MNVQKSFFIFLRGMLRGTSILVLFKLYLSWLIFFGLNRLSFLLYNYDLLRSVDTIEIFKSFIAALSLDTSMASYLMVIPFLMLSIALFKRFSWIIPAIQGYQILLMFVISIIVSSEMELYREWGTKLNYKALLHLENPSEVYGITSNKVLFYALLNIILQTTAGVFLTRWAINKYSLFERPRVFISVFYCITIPGILFLGIRGGINPIPINISDAYYSSHNILNLASVNSTWHLMQSVETNYSNLDTNPYNYYSLEEVNETVNGLFKRNENDSTIKVFAKERPNMVLVLLEGWSSHLIKPLGGADSITPNLNRFAEDGILFTHFLATGGRSDQGITGLLSGFPAQPTTSVTHQPSKYPGLPSLPKKLENLGYSSLFIFGGELNYANIRSFLIYSGIKKMVEDRDFDFRIPRAKLGVHDEYLYPRFIEEINQLQPPFFAISFNLSSHAPYDIPVPYKFKWGGHHNGYINSVHYADSCLGELIKMAQKQDWYDNTVFIITADHSHPTHKEVPVYMPENRKIPFLLYGPALKKEFKGKRMHNIASQVDFSPTILAQMNLAYDEFEWGKNMLTSNPKEFAFFTFDNGASLEKPDGFYAYSHNQKRVFSERFDTTANKNLHIRECKSCLQKLFQDYLEL